MEDLSPPSSRALDYCRHGSWPHWYPVHNGDEGWTRIDCKFELLLSVGLTQHPKFGADRVFDFTITIDDHEFDGT